jgi:predicted NUDIX family phosphoesterase
MEFVYVVPRDVLFPDCYPQGFSAFGDDSAYARFREKVERQGFFVERAYAERTPTLKQIIPYCVVRTLARPYGEERFLLLRRTKAGGEERLHEKLSIGVGGHVNPEDVLADVGSERRILDAGTRREIEEELELAGPYEIRPLGILNDDSNPVGAVHVGVVQIVTTTGRVGIREKDQLEGRCVSRSELAARLGQGANFETWSELLITALFADESEEKLGAPPTSNTSLAAGISRPVGSAKS